MEELTLEHLAPYLPYSIKGLQESNNLIWWLYRESNICRQEDNYHSISINDFIIYDLKPILRPLSDLTKEIIHKREKFAPVEWFEIGDDEDIDSFDYDSGNVKLCKNLETISKHDIHHDINFLPYGVVKKLHEWHFDVFGLIEKGLAIDINTLNDEK